MGDRRAQQFERILLLAAIRPDLDGRLAAVRHHDGLAQRLDLTEQFAGPGLENGFRYSLFHDTLHPSQFKRLFFASDQRLRSNACMRRSDIRYRPCLIACPQLPASASLLPRHVSHRQGAAADALSYKRYVSWMLRGSY